MSDLLKRFVENTDLQTLDFIEFQSIAEKFGLHGSFYVRLRSSEFTGADDFPNGFDHVMHLRIDKNWTNRKITGDVFEISRKTKRPKQIPIYSFEAESYLHGETHRSHLHARGHQHPHPMTIHAMCDAYVTSKTKPYVVSNGLEKLLLKVTFLTKAVGAIEIGLLEDKKTGSLKYAATQTGGISKLKKAFRRIEIDYEMALGGNEGEYDVLSADFKEHKSTTMSGPFRKLTQKHCLLLLVTFSP